MLAHQTNPEEFEKALEEFVQSQLPDLEKLLMEVVDGMYVRHESHKGLADGLSFRGDSDHAFDPSHSPAVTERESLHRISRLQAHAFLC